MFRTVLIAAAALTAATAASAEPKPEASDTAAVSATTAAAPAKRYCVVDTLTGSRLQQRECKSLDAWLAEGFDPRAKK